MMMMMIIGAVAIQCFAFSQMPGYTTSKHNLTSFLGEKIIISFKNEKADGKPNEVIYLESHGMWQSQNQNLSVLDSYALDATVCPGSGSPFSICNHLKGLTVAK